MNLFWFLPLMVVAIARGTAETKISKEPVKEGDPTFLLQNYCSGPPKTKNCIWSKCDTLPCGSARTLAQCKSVCITLV